MEWIKTQSSNPKGSMQGRENLWGQTHQENKEKYFVLIWWKLIDKNKFEIVYSSQQIESIHNTSLVYLRRYDRVWEALGKLN